MEVRNIMSVKTQQFNVMLDPELLDTLGRLAQHEGCSKAAVTRRAIVDRAIMTFERIPTCANGHPCIASAMHPLLHQAPPTDGPPLPATKVATA